MQTKIILASGSKARSEIMAAAGLEFDVVLAKVDEFSIKASLQEEGAKPNDVVDALAEYKALRVASKNPDALVIGCDQILICENKIYDKATNLDDARAKLKELRGKPHLLLSAAVIFENGKPIWRTVGRAQLFMRDFSDAFLDGYLVRNKEAAISSVGCYYLEAEGVQLFNRIQGDYFTVLGFPLLDVLQFLRSRGIVTK